MDGWDSKPTHWEDTKETIILKVTDNDNLYKKQLTDYAGIEAIFILAGGLTEDGNLHDWVIRRLDLAYQVYKMMIKKPTIICQGGGTYHKPPILNKNSYVIHESTACAEYLIKLGIPADHIYKEWSSYDTIANGFFAFSNFIIPINIKKIMVVTSDFHLTRARIIFDWFNSFGYGIDIHYLGASDEGLKKEIISIRIKREARSSTNLLQNTIPKIKSMKQFHKWFHTEHKAYCADSELIRSCDIQEECKSSY